MAGQKLIGYACTYTPLVLLRAAGYTPYRILPNLDCPDRAGQILHDNLCPHVKMILNRVMSNSVPDLKGLVLMNSCDAMRRLADAWKHIDKQMPVVLLDLPVVSNNISVSFFRNELIRMAGILSEWNGVGLNREAILNSIREHNAVADYFGELCLKLRDHRLAGGAESLQKAYNLASVSNIEETKLYLKGLLSLQPDDDSSSGVPVFLFGNIMTETELFVLFEELGARIVAEDMCTGSRLFQKIEVDESADDIFYELALNILNKKPCARTIYEATPGIIADNIIREARQNGARGVIGYTAKFCDPYIARIPLIRDGLKNEDIPFLLLEGDCLLRSIGQQRTRIEAFMEMLR